MRSDVLTFLVLALLSYILWLQRGELDLLAEDIATLRLQVGDLAKRPAAKPKPQAKPKPTTA